jgi:hypothetical protein
MKDKNQKLALIKDEKNGWAAFAILWRAAADMPVGT